MAKITISLPDYLQEYVDAEIVRRGPVLTRAVFVEQLVLNAYLDKHRDRIESLLLQGISSGPATPMTKEDWEDIRREGLARLPQEDLSWKP